jgi:alpha-glucosidase
MCLRGNVFVYYGEELGLDQVEIAFDELQDPEAIANWPLTLSRDGARTPMPWVRDEVGAGFTTGKPWLPLGVANRARAVDVQEGDSDSLLHLTRRLIAWRNASSALRWGSARVVTAEGDLLVIERIAPEEHLLCAFNFGAGPLDWSPPQPDRWRTVESVGTVDSATLGGLSALVARKLA